MSKDEDFTVYYDSDEFRACETMAKQKVPLEVAVTRLIDFHGMDDDEARAYYLEAMKNS
ncbi:hypothetical protein N8000_05305 [Rhodospirillales bacterium]|nr:hypothetical protein [Rhodospirillales bacterium]